jgi:hypothetical protein
MRSFPRDARAAPRFDRYSESTFAAQMKSFSDSPPIECVANVMRQ